MDTNNLIAELPSVEDYEPLITAAQRGDLLLFVGAGVSRIVGSPSWEGLAKKHLDFIFDCGLINYSEYKHLEKQNPRKLLSICKELTSKDVKGRSFNIQKVLEDDIRSTPNTYSDIYQYLDNFNCPYVTTNFDGFLDSDLILLEATTGGDASKVNPVKKTIYHHYSDLQDPALLKPHDVAHIHGSLHDPQLRPLVLTIKEYFRAYSRSKTDGVTDLPEFLARLFKEKVVLFMGYGLEEYEILEFVVNNIEDPTDMRHYMLSPFMKEESNIIPLQRTYYKQLGINLIPFSISCIGYQQLYNVIKEWSKIIGKSSKPKTFLDDLSTIDSVL
jgi:hypothetical protein